MLLEQMIKENPGINLTVKAGELMEFGQQIADRAVKTFLQKHDEKVYNRKEVVEKFGICETTLWRWDKMGLIESKKIGNRVFYPESEIKRLTSQKGGEK
jgi:predicted DNA-binding transcriptional regulator AlpA